MRKLSPIALLIGLVYFAYDEPGVVDHVDAGAAADRYSPKPMRTIGAMFR